MNEPIVGAQYDWQGMSVSIINAEPSPYSFCKCLVTVEYFNKATKQWAKLKTPFDGTFKLTFQPHVKFC